MKKIFYLVFILPVVFSCTKEVKIDIPDYEEQIVVDGNIETGQPPFVILSRSKDIYAPTDLNSFLNGFISGAEVYVNDGTTTYQLDEVCSDELPPGFESFAAEIFGVPESEVSNYHLCAYTKLDGSIVGEVGKTYTLTVNFEGKTYTAETKIVNPTPLDSTYFKLANNATDKGFSYAQLTDPPGFGDSYFWEAKRINKNSDGQEKDSYFTPTYAPVFDDQFINDITFEFYFENPVRDPDLPSEYRGYFKVGDTVVIKFSKLDKDVYEYMDSKYIQLQSGGSPFSTPTNVKSNIKGGALGVWAGFSPSYDTIVCQP